MARAQYRFDHFYLTRPLSALSHVFHFFVNFVSLRWAEEHPSRLGMLFYLFSQARKKPAP